MQQDTNNQTFKPERPKNPLKAPVIKKARRKIYTHFVGIDISKNELDFAVYNDNDFLFHREIKNQPEEIIKLVAALKTLPGFSIRKTIFALEHTGIYSNHLLEVLKSLKADVAFENALKIINSSGLIRNKHDKVDAMRIAQYAYKNREELTLWTPKRLVVMELMNLTTLRRRLLRMSVAVSTPLKEEGYFLKPVLQQQTADLCKNTLEAVQADLINVNQVIEQLIHADERLRRLQKLITSVPGVGTVTATQIIICTNEFINIDEAKKFACYAGVAPFKKESGTVTGKAKVSKIANKYMKSLLHTCALVAVIHDKEIRDYFERKTNVDHKPKMAVYNAVRNKLILRIFACVKHDRLYVKEFESPVQGNKVNQSKCGQE